MVKYECDFCKQYKPFLYHQSFTDYILVCKECAEAKDIQITKKFNGDPILY